MISTRNNRTLSDLVHAHAGRAAIVMGGAPSLLPDLRATAAVSYPVRISANQHAFVNGLYLPEAIDYIVACDNKMRELLQAYGRPIIAPRHWADYRVLHQHVSNSAALACIAAWVMGCAPIIVCGVELYSGGTYWHDAKAPSSGKTVPVDQHLRRWAKLTEAAPGAMIRAVSGPLLHLFAAFDPFDPNEPPLPIAPAEEIMRIVRGERVEILNNVPNWHGTSYRAGDVIETRKSEAGQLILQRDARRYTEARA